MIHFENSEVGITLAMQKASRIDLFSSTPYFMYKLAPSLTDLIEDMTCFKVDCTLSCKEILYRSAPKTQSVFMSDQNIIASSEMSIQSSEGP